MNVDNALRLESCYSSVVRYLVNQGYLNYLSREELNAVLGTLNFKDLPEYLKNMINSKRKGVT